MLRVFIVAILVLYGVSKSFAQQFTPRYNISIGSNCNGFYEYLPLGYDPVGTQKYPLLIALHGVGERGDGGPNTSTGLPLLVLPDKGMASLINSGAFPASFTVGGNTYRFIVICPQFTDNGTMWPGAADLSAIISYATSNYKVDLNRVYLTGLSMGGGICFNYVSLNAQNSSQIAAIVPVCAALQPGPPYAAKPDSVACRTITGTNLPLWATHNIGDATVPISFSDSLVHDVNAVPAPAPLARETRFNSWIWDHDAWTKTFDPTYTGFDGMNMYQWMLQYQRFITPLPVQLKNYNAALYGESSVLISWQTENEINNDFFTLERSADGIEFSTIAVIKGLNFANAYRYVDVHPLKENYYRLSQTDKDGKKTYYSILKVVFAHSDMDFKIIPNPSSSQVKLSFYSDKEETVIISITNTIGIKIKEFIATKTSGIYEKIIGVNDLVHGVYFLQVKGIDFSESKAFLKN